jgi:hypothetical protein
MRRTTPYHGCVHRTFLVDRCPWGLQLRTPVWRTLATGSDIAGDAATGISTSGRREALHPYGNGPAMEANPAAGKLSL